MGELSNLTATQQACGLAPAVIASGGPANYIKTNLGYVTNQAPVGSALLGATKAMAQTAFWRLVVWTLYGVLGFTMSAVLAWRRREGWGLGRRPTAFLAIWFMPSFAFAISVHVEDPGQVLVMVPVVSLFGGYLMSRALGNLGLWISRWHALTLSVSTLTMAWFAVLWVPVAALATGLLLTLAQTENAGYSPRTVMFLFLQAPAPAMDDQVLRQRRRLADERPGNTVVIFGQGMTTWRKAAYYAPRVPVIVLQHKLIRAGSPR